MNSDQIKGKASQVAGRVKQGAGDLTGNEKLANEGVADQVKGSVQETWGNAKDAAHEAAKNREAEVHQKQVDAREKVSQNVET